MSRRPVEPSPGLRRVLNKLLEARERQVCLCAREQARLTYMDRTIARLSEGTSMATPWPKVVNAAAPRGLGIVEGAKQLLQEMGEPQTTVFIAAALLSRGVATRSERFIPTVYATLAKAKNTFERQGRLWALRDGKAPPLS